MQPIVATIKPNDSGPQVANLIEGLLFLKERGVFRTFDPPGQPTLEQLNEAAANVRLEVTDSVFGEVTFFWVTLFQWQQDVGIQSIGSVDDATAAKLNQLLKDNGAVFHEDLYEVGGKVYDGAGAVAGVRVVAFYADLVQKEALGETRSDGDGHYRITFPAGAFRKTGAERGVPELFVRAYDEQGLEIGTSRRVNNATPVTRLDVQVTPERWIVEGNITQGDIPAAGALVEVFDRDLRKRQNLGTTVADSKGQYRVTFRTLDFQRADKKLRPTPWLIVEARATDASPAVTVEKREGVQQRETIDVQLGVIAPIEWEQISSLVQPLLAGKGPDARDLALHELLPSDVEVLAHETMLDAPKLFQFVDTASSVPRLAGSDGEARKPDTALRLAELFYGLLRGGSADQVDGLISVPRQALEATLSLATDRHIVSAALTKDAPRLLDIWDRLRAPWAAKRTSAGGSSSVQSVLDRLGIQVPDTLASRARLVAARHGVMHAAALAELESAADLEPAEQEALPRLRTALAMSEAAGRDADLLNALLGVAPTLPQIPKPEHMVRLSRADWLRVAESVKVPPAAPGVSPESAEKRASRLMRRFDSQYLADAAHWRVERGELQLSADASARLSALIKEHPEARLAGTGPAALVRAIKKSVTDPHSPDSAREEILRLDAMLKACGTTLDVIDLQQTGFRSIADAINAGRGHFIEAMTRSGGGAAAWSEAHANDTYEKLYHVVDAGTIALISQAVEKSSPSPAALNRDASTLAGLSMPALCACEPCRSVLSVSAYLADLLRFLRDAETLNGRNPYDELIRRRPDVQEVLLDCANETTEACYIDLVNEVLERAVIDVTNLSGLENLTLTSEIIDQLNAGTFPSQLRADLV